MKRNNYFLEFIKGFLYVALWLFDLFLLYVSGDTIHSCISSGGPVNFIVQESFVLFMASISLPAMCFISVIPTFLNSFCLTLHVIVLIIRVSMIGFSQDDYGVYPEEKTDYYIESIFILVNTNIWLVLVITNIIYSKMKGNTMSIIERVDDCSWYSHLVSVILKSRSQQKPKKEATATHQTSLDAISVTASLPSYRSEDLPNYDRDIEEALPRYSSSRLNPQPPV